MKFKQGDTVFDLRYGAGQVKEVGEFALWVVLSGDTVEYNLDGTDFEQHKNPVLWTEAETRQRGYGDQLPIKPFRWEGRVENISMDCTWLAELLKGKRGTLTFVEDVE